jgi:hypothetical protein
MINDDLLCWFGWVFFGFFFFFWWRSAEEGKQRSKGHGGSVFFFDFAELSFALPSRMKLGGGVEGMRCSMMRRKKVQVYRRSFLISDMVCSSLR